MHDRPPRLTPGDSGRPRTADHSALERTFDSWVRTGLALCALGFVIVRLGYYLEELGRVSGVVIPAARTTMPIGMLHLFLGVAAIAFAAVWHRHSMRQLDAGQDEPRRPVTFVVIMVTIGSLIGGAALAVDLVFSWPR